MKANNTKKRLLRVGVEQLSVQGFAGVTLGQLASASGLSKSGLFAHFPSKEALQIELLDETARIADNEVVKPAMHAGKGLPRLKALVQQWFGWSIKAGLGGGCPVAAAQFELDDIEGKVRSHLSELEMQWRALLSQLVSEAVVEKHLSDETDIEQFVWELCGIYLNHHVSSRFSHDPKADLRAEQAFLSLIQRYKTIN